MKILAIKLRAIGDTVIWTSALAALREQFPKAEITVMTYATNSAVLVGTPYADKFYFIHKRTRWAMIVALWRARWWRYDWLLGFHATSSLCKWAWLARAKKMVLHHHSWRHTPIGSVKILEPGKLENAIARDYQVVRALILATSAQAETQGVPLGILPKPTRIAVSEEEARRAEEELCAVISSVGGNPQKPRMAFLPGAGHHLRRYPKDLWLKILEREIQSGESQPVVMADSALAKEWSLDAECAQRKVPLFADGSLREFIIHVSRCQKAFANDSGPGHMAVALGLETTFVFGPGCVGDWHPYDSTKHPVQRVKVDCRSEGPRDQERFQFCTVNECAHHKCMRGIQF